MPRSGVVAAAVLLSIGFGLPPAFNQSLGELAQKEKARREREREKKGGSSKVFTEQDLERTDPGRPPSTSSQGEIAAGSPTPGSEESRPPTPRRQSRDDGEVRPDDESAGESPGTGEPQAGGADQSTWKARAANARNSLKAVESEAAAAEAEVERLRQDLNPMSTTFSTDPYVIQRLQSQLTEAQAKAASAQEALKKAKDAYTAFEDDARRAGVPPGWLRE